jgi:hypothetical protein
VPDLYVYYSFSGRTQHLILDLAKRDPSAVVLQLEPVEPLIPPISTLRLLWWILKARRGWDVPIKPVKIPAQEFDGLVIGSPTWSGLPAGPVRSFLDRDLPGIRFRRASYIISCRRSWEGTVRYLEERIGQPMTGRVVPYEGSTIRSYLETWRHACRRPFDRNRETGSL